MGIPTVSHKGFNLISLISKQKMTNAAVTCNRYNAISMAQGGEMAAEPSVSAPLEQRRGKEVVQHRGTLPFLREETEKVETRVEIPEEKNLKQTRCSGTTVDVATQTDKVRTYKTSLILLTFVALFALYVFLFYAILNNPVTNVYLSAQLNIAIVLIGYYVFLPPFQVLGNKVANIVHRL
ncbi:hypothetical protein B566_EDAN005124 [Ephemera danica]|nr:hypothetical protein B566_EDAN005124 [Ephemera danica]